MTDYWPKPWRVEQDEQCGLIIVAANGWPVYKWPLYITADTAKQFPNDACRQFEMDGCCIADNHLQLIVDAVNEMK
jgi:hypothetical protein